MFRKIFSFPLPKLFVFAIGGILFQNAFYFPSFFFVASFVTILTLRGLLIWRKKISFKNASFFLYLSFFTFFSFLTSFKEQVIPITSTEKKDFFVGIIESKKVKTKIHGVLKIIAEKRRDSLFSVNERTYYFADSSKNISQNDVIAFFGKVKKVKQDDFGNYLHSLGINKISSFYRIEKLTTLPSSRPLLFISKVRNYISEKIDFFYRNVIHRSILKALVLGNKSHLDEATKKAFANSGMSHILAVSGMHIGIIYLILNVVFSSIQRKNTQRNKLFNTLFVLLGVWFFALLSGLSKSVFRAGVMFSIFQISTNTKRNVNSFNTLFGAGIILLALDTSSIHNIGFQLSFLAVFGILYCMKLLPNISYSRLSFLKKGILSALFVTVSAQLFVFPIIVYYFKTAPLYFIFPNLVVGILLFPVMLLGVVQCFLFEIEVLAHGIATINGFLVEIIHSMATFFSSLPYSEISLSFSSPIYIVIYYIILIIIIEIFHQRKIRKI